MKLMEKIWKDQYIINNIGFMQLAKIFFTKYGVQHSDSDSVRLAAALPQDRHKCNQITARSLAMPRTQNWPMRIGPLLLVASHDFWHCCYQWTFLVCAAAKKVKPKVELRGSIMALSNTGGRWWANWWALKRMAKTVLLQYINDGN